MDVLLLSTANLDDAWFSPFIAQLKHQQPDLVLRLWPERGHLANIECVLAWLPPLGVMQRLPRLRLIISLSASVDAILADPALPEHIPIVRLVSEGKSTQMAEYVALMALLFQRRLLEYQQLQARQCWKPLPLLDANAFPIGVLGLGELGKAVAKKLTAIGFSVRGWSRTEKMLAGVHCFYGEQQLASFLKPCRVLVCLLPLTTMTKGILSHRLFALLPQGASLINVGRGEHLIEADVLQALASGQLATACLDVFDQEPLPKDTS